MVDTFLSSYFVDYIPTIQFYPTSMNSNSYLLLTLKCKVSLLVDISRETFCRYFWWPSPYKRSRDTRAGNEPTVHAIVMNCWRCGKNTVIILCA